MLNPKAPKQMNMKKILITLALVATTVTSLAQGKITIGNDATHLIAWLATGTPISQATGWNNLTMQLWGGPYAGSMALQTTFVGAAIGNPAFDDGRINNTMFTLIGVPGGTTAYLQLRFLDITWGNVVTGQSPVFTVTAGSFAPNPIVLGPPGGTSTWAAGNVYVGPMPEPTSVALTGLGAACLLMFRRRR